MSDTKKISVRIPVEWYTILKAEAEKEEKTLSNVIKEKINPKKEVSTR